MLWVSCSGSVLNSLKSQVFCPTVSGLFQVELTTQARLKTYGLPYTY